jgi:hypothetical protein
MSTAKWGQLKPYFGVFPKHGSRLILGFRIFEKNIEIAIY